MTQPEPYSALWEAIHAYAEAVAATQATPSCLLRRLAAEEVDRRVFAYAKSHVDIVKRNMAAENRGEGSDG